MSPRKTERAARTTIIAVTLGATLAGCSDLYFDRRDTIVLGGSDALAANQIAQTVDPWPAYSGNAAITANGQKMQSAVERYRTNRVIPPVSTTTSTFQSQPAPLPPPLPVYVGAGGSNGGATAPCASAQ